MDSWNFAYFYDNIAESSFPISTKSVIIFTCLQFTYSGLLFRLIRLTVYTGFTWIALPIIKKCQIIKNIDTWTFIENCVKTAIDNSFLQIIVISVYVQPVQATCFYCFVNFSLNFEFINSWVEISGVADWVLLMVWFLFW